MRPRGVAGDRHSALNVAPSVASRLRPHRPVGEDARELFLEWIGQKPKGYVLHTDAGMTDRGSTRLHRASCFTLEPGFGGGERQTVDYIKVCSPEPKELNEWAVGNPGYGLRSLRCPHCEPTSLALTD